MSTISTIQEVTVTNTGTLNLTFKSNSEIVNVDVGQSKPLIVSPTEYNVRAVGNEAVVAKVLYVNSGSCSTSGGVGVVGAQFTATVKLQDK